MLAITQNLTFNTDNEADLERELIDHVLENMSEFYMNIFDLYANSFKEYILSSRPWTKNEFYH